MPARVDPAGAVKPHRGIQSQSGEGGEEKWNSYSIMWTVDLDFVAGHCENNHARARYSLARPTVWLSAAKPRDLAEVA